MSDPRRGLFRNSIVVAAIATIVVSALLALAVWSAWRGGSSPSPSQPTAVAALDAPTPTPRAIRFSTPTPETSDEGVPTEAPAPATALVPTQPAVTVSDTAVAKPNATPASSAVAVVMPNIDEGLPPAAASPAASTAATRLAEFADPATLGQMAGGSWQVADNLLSFVGEGGNAEQWLVVPGVSPTGDFAIEVEARVSDLNPGFCDQSFGLVAGAAGGTVWGGGLIYPCDNQQPVARITDATAWQDGYNQDPTLARAPFSPGNGWHTYRLELDGGTIRLLVDGQQVAQAENARGEELRAAPGQVGIWSQGVRLDVRRVVVDQQ